MWQKLYESFWAMHDEFFSVHSNYWKIINQQEAGTWKIWKVLTPYQCQHTKYEVILISYFCEENMFWKSARTRFLLNSPHFYNAISVLSSIQHCYATYLIVSFKFIHMNSVWICCFLKLTKFVQLLFQRGSSCNTNWCNTI